MTKQITFRATIPPIQSALKFGANVGRVTLEIPEIELANAIALIPLQNCVLRVTVELEEGAKPVKAVKPKKEKGAWGMYWHELFGVKFHEMEMVWEVLEVDAAEEVKPALHEVFGVESLSFVSPAEFEAWCDKNHLQPLITLSRQAVMKAAA